MPPGSQLTEQLRDQEPPDLRAFPRMGGAGLEPGTSSLSGNFQYGTPGHVRAS
jgi:hypothetical protein